MGSDMKFTLLTSREPVFFFNVLTDAVMKMFIILNSFSGVHLNSYPPLHA